MKKILCAGLLVCDIAARNIEDIDYKRGFTPIDAIRIGNGGDAMNVALTLAALGADTGFCGCVGDDAQGGLLRNILEKAGVSTKGLLSKPGISTTCCLVMINEKNEHCFFGSKGSADTFSCGDIPDRLLEEYDHIHVSGINVMPEFDGKGVAALLKKAKEAGKTTSMDVTDLNHGTWQGNTLPALPYVDDFLPSIGEAGEISGKKTAEEAAAFFIECGAENVVIKKGEEGCYFIADGKEGNIPAYKVKTVDTTGAGDTFVGGFLAARSKGFAYEECVKTGCATAAFNVQNLGAAKGIPSFETVRAYMDKEAL